jgi:hypothetical protein
MSSYSEHIRDKYEDKSLSPSQKEDLDQFCEWLDEVENIVEEETGYDLLSLPEQTYRDFFDDNLSPETVAEIVVEDLRVYRDVLID